MQRALAREVAIQGGPGGGAAALAVDAGKRNRWSAFQVLRQYVGKRINVRDRFYVHTVRCAGSKGVWVHHSRRVWRWDRDLSS